MTTSPRLLEAFARRFVVARAWRGFASTTARANAAPCLLSGSAAARRPRLRLQQIHFPGLIDYRKASLIQEIFVRRMLDYKAATPRPSHVVPPVILTFQMEPVFTLGRRGNGKHRVGDRPPAGTEALVVETLRGGQTTFHGPGQLVSYPIIDLLTHYKPEETTPESSGVTPQMVSSKLPMRCYVSLLEKTIIKLLNDHFGVRAMTTDNTGVWINDDDKIAAIGVHLRRNVTSHGIALNISTDTAWFKKVSACGLNDKNTVNLQMVLDGQGRSRLIDVDSVARLWGQELSESLGWDLDYIEAKPEDYLKN